MCFEISRGLKELLKIVCISKAQLYDYDTGLTPIFKRWKKG